MSGNGMRRQADTTFENYIISFDGGFRHSYNMFGRICFRCVCVALFGFLNRNGIWRVRNASPSYGVADGWCVCVLRSRTIRQCALQYSLFLSLRGEAIVRRRATHFPGDERRDNAILLFFFYFIDDAHMHSTHTELLCAPQR